MNTTAIVSSAAIKVIREARKAGHEVLFNTRGGQEVASYCPGPHVFVTIFANGDTEEEFTGEDAGVEAAIERYNDARTWAEGCPSWAM